MVATFLASVPLLVAAAVAYWAFSTSGEPLVSGPEATGGSIILMALAIAPLYVAVAFPMRATLLLRRGQFNSYAFRKGQTLLLALTCLVLSLIAVALLGGISLDGLAMAASLTVLTTFVSALICFPSVFIWLKLAQ